MTGWNEQNFLEELGPLLRRCPEPEVLCAVQDGEASPSVREAVEAHAARCPDCAKLQRRLAGFETGGVADWPLTEKRLDNWFDACLPQRPAQQPEPPARPRRWQLRWAVAAAAALIAAAAVFIMLPRREEPVETTAVSAIPAPPAPIELPSQPPQEFDHDAIGKLATVAKSAPANPPRLRLDAGTRMWILLKSLHRMPDQTFEFSGVVLLPVTHGESVLLDQSTEVHGTGAVNQGRTSVRILDLGLHGTNYRLAQPAEIAGERAPGSTANLPYDTGQVLEMWLASESSFRKVSGDAGQP